MALKLITRYTNLLNSIRQNTCCLMLCLSLGLTQAAFARPLIVLSDNTPSYQKVLRSISSATQTNFDSISVSKLTKTPEILSENERDYIVAIGSRATAFLMERLPEGSSTLIATFIPRRSYQALVAKYKNAPIVREKGVAAVYLDQPYTRQLRLARLIKPEAKILSVAFSSASATDLPLLTRATKETGFTLKHTVLNENHSPIKQLQPLIEASDLFLTLPDKAVFNRTTAKWILYISYRQRVPLLGFSKKYVDAGAVAGVYSSPEQIGQQTGELLNQLQQSVQNIHRSVYPIYFSVATNPSAAKSLRIHIPDATQLEQQLREAEQ